MISDGQRTHPRPETLCCVLNGFDLVNDITLVNEVNAENTKQTFSSDPSESLIDRIPKGRLNGAMRNATEGGRSLKRHATELSAVRESRCDHVCEGTVRKDPMGALQIKRDKRRRHSSNGGENPQIRDMNRAAKQEWALDYRRDSIWEAAPHYGDHLQQT